MSTAALGATDDGAGATAAEARSRFEIWWYCGAAVFFLAAYATSFTLGSLQPGTPDGLDYTALAHKAGLSSEFLAGPRTPVFPLLWNLLDFDDTTLLIVQVVLGAAAWLVLAWQTRRVFQLAAVRVGGFVVVLLMGLSTQVMIWNGIAGTESLSISLMCLALAAAIAWALAPRKPIAPAVLCVVVLLWAFTRDANAYYVLLAGIAGAGWFAVAWIRGRRDPSARLHLRWLIIPTVFVLVFALNYSSSEQGRRWEYSFYNVLVFRVLPSNDRTDWFVEHGMPAAEVRAVSRGYEQGKQLDDLIASPELRRLRDWVEAEGRSTYVEFLATHPGYAFDAFRSRVDDQFSSHGVEAYGMLWSYEPPPANFLSDIVYPHWAVLLLVWAIGAAVALGVVWRGSRTRDREWIAVLVVAVAVNVFVMAIVWAADPTEIGRHEMGPAIAMRYLIWFATLFSIDRLVHRRADREHRDDERSSSSAAPARA